MYILTFTISYFSSTHSKYQTNMMEIESATNMKNERSDALK